MPTVVAHNWTIQDASHYWLTGCTRTSGVATCTVATGGSNPAFSLLDKDGAQHCFYVTGTSDTTFTNAGLVQCPTSETSSTVTFSNAGSNVASGVTGGWLSPAHLVFGFELNSNNASHDPGAITESLGGPLPVWGFVSTSTPFTWTNPTGGGNIPNLPLSAGFIAAGTSNAASGGQHIGFLGQDAIDDIFVAGYPQVGGTVSAAKSGFRARPIASAINGTNYASQKSCWDTSIFNGTSGYNDATYCMWFAPVSNAANASSVFQFAANGFPSIFFTQAGGITAQSGSSSALTYGFNGWTNGLYNNGGVNTFVGQVSSTSSINAVGGFQSNGAAGGSATVNVRNSTNTGACTITYQGGLFISTTCP